MSASESPGAHEDASMPLSASWHRRVFGAVLLCATLLGPTGCATTSRPAAPSLADVVQMSEDGLADDQIIILLRESNAVYPLSASQILDLNGKGVSTEVLDYMQQAYVISERRRERLIYGDPYWRGHYWGYPCFGCPYPYYGIAPFYTYSY